MKKKRVTRKERREKIKQVQLGWELVRLIRHFSRPDIAIKRRNGSETSKLHTVWKSCDIDDPNLSIHILLWFVIKRAVFHLCIRSTKVCENRKRITRNFKTTAVTAGMTMSMGLITMAVLSICWSMASQEKNISVSWPIYPLHCEKQNPIIER